MILAILAFYWGYTKGRDSGRSGALWSVICGVTFLAIQMLFGLGIGIVIGLGSAMWGWDEKILDTYSLLISLVAVIPAGLALWLIFKYLDRVPDEPYISINQPPPPPNFDSNNGQ